MYRREFIKLIGGATASWPLQARAQQKALPAIGYLGVASPDAWAGRLKAFRQGLSESGFVEGRNVTIEYRWADNQYDRLQTLVADLVSRGVNVIVTPGSGSAALAALAASRTIPIVFETGVDPVAMGLVTSLNRPGYNVTGVTSLNLAFGPKRLEVLHEVVPLAKLIAGLVNPAAGDSVERPKQDLQTAARSMGLELLVLQAVAERDIDLAFSTLLEQRAGGLVIIPDAFLISRREQLATLSLRHGVPAISQGREFAAAGGLMSYGGDVAETHRLAGIYTGRVLKGEKPADLPVIQGTKAELIINLKTAKTLGLDVPPALLARADEVIE
jgi:putative tryptophan/tyrosine transport system substrate-binding protein